MSILKVVQAQPQQLAVGNPPQFQQPSQTPQQAPAQNVLDMVNSNALHPATPNHPIQGSPYSQTAPQVGVDYHSLGYLANPNPWVPFHHVNGIGGVQYTQAGRYAGTFYTPELMALPIQQPNYPTYQKLPLMGR